MRWTPVLKIAAEGGSLQVEACLGKRPSFRWQLAEFDVESDRHHEHKSQLFISLEDALRSLDRYPWAKFHPLFIGAQWRDDVIAAVRERLGPRGEHWLSIWENVVDPVNNYSSIEEGAGFPDTRSSNLGADLWDWGNEVLYRMCRETPEHYNHHVIVGKIWLIGRSYSATLERKAGDHLADGLDAFYAERVAPMIASSGIDDWLSSTADIKRVEHDNVQLVLHVHNRFTELLKSISGISKRSLASKYLHFHQPCVFFIYDSIASNRINSLLPRFRVSNKLSYDAPYERFLRQCLHYRDTVLEPRLGRACTPRELDKVLLDPSTGE